MINKQELKEIIQSSNLNFLIGSGMSTPYLPLLNDIEKKLTNEPDEAKRIPIYRDYFEKVMLPNHHIVAGTIDKKREPDFTHTWSSYKTFFELISFILLNRKSTILSKQANLFTTNIDVFMEMVMEESNLEYNDGFSGKIHPSFSLSNFKKSILKRSLHFENVSEIPVFNLIKIHGSLTWSRDADNIGLSRLELVNEAMLKLKDKEFYEKYQKIAVVNPEPKKLQETVVDLTYYELLRMYSSELEKENSVLFVMGFSMADAHIREITIRSANSNPTLKIYIFCHHHDNIDSLKKIVEIGRLRYSNIEIVCPPDKDEKNRYSFDKINNDIFKGIIPQKKETSYETE